MEQLRNLDQVAYVRFASVYREFKDPSQFLDALRPMLEQTGASLPPDAGAGAAGGEPAPGGGGRGRGRARMSGGKAAGGRGALGREDRRGCDEETSGVPHHQA
jgi:hypothetical protein